MESGEAEIATERFDLHALIKTAASELKARAGAKGVTTGVYMTGVYMAANCPRFIIGDEARVRHVLTVRIEASLQSTSKSSIRLYSSVNDAEMPLTVRFDVTDTGAGLSAAQQASPFQPMADTSRADDLPCVLASINARVVKSIQGRVLHAALVPFLAAKDEPVTVAKAS